MPLAPLRHQYQAESAIGEVTPIYRDLTNAACSTVATVKRRLAAFFRDNRFTMDTAEGLSQWLGCTADEVSSAAEALVDDGILVRRGAHQFAIYSLARDADARQRMDVLLSS